MSGSSTTTYFTQTILPDYLDERGVDWDVIYDARGHFTEPHDGESFGIGTLEVRQYLNGFHDPDIINAGFSQAKVKTKGPSGNFGAVLFIEKEGFAPILKAAQMDELDAKDCKPPKNLKQRVVTCWRSIPRCDGMQRWLRLRFTAPMHLGEGRGADTMSTCRFLGSGAPSGCVGAATRISSARRSTV